MTDQTASDGASDRASDGASFASRVAAAAAATWPPARHWRIGPMLMRDGRGGGKRVSAASALAPAGAHDIDAAAGAMRAAGHLPLFLIDGGAGGPDPSAGPSPDSTLDAALAARGYAVVDPVMMLAAALPLAGAVPAGVIATDGWPATAAARRLWLAAGIGAARRAVMARAGGPRTVVRVRRAGRVVAAAFVACDGDVAVVHALEVAPGARRQGIGRAAMLHAAAWSSRSGARAIAVLVTTANGPARGLYDDLSLVCVGGYHYRQAPS